MESEPFEDVFPIENGDFPLLCLITGGYLRWVFTVFGPGWTFPIFKIAHSVQRFNRCDRACISHTFSTATPQTKNQKTHHLTSPNNF